MQAASPGPPALRRAAWIGLAGFALAAAFIGLQVARTSVEDARVGVPYVALYDTPRSALEVILNQGDGQSFAALAIDPTLAHPEVFRQGAAEAAYRAQRPLLGWLGWLLSGGQASAVPWVLALLTALSAGFLTFASALLAEQRGRVAWPMLLVILLPGSLVALTWIGPEMLATGLAVAGLLCWQRRPPLPWLAGALFALAVFARETTLLVPVVVALHEILLAQRGSPLGARLGRAVPLGLAPALWLAWIVVLHARVGAWPTAAAPGRRLELPFVGIVSSASWQVADVVVAVALVCVVVAAVVVSRTDVLTWLVVGYGAFALVMGAEVWERWEDFSRPLLPMLVFALTLFLPRSLEVEPAR